MINETFLSTETQMPAYLIPMHKLSRQPQAVVNQCNQRYKQYKHNLCLHNLCFKDFLNTSQHLSYILEAWQYKIVLF